MIVLGLGANLDSPYGTAEQTIKNCPDILNQHGIRVLKFSSIWKSAPVPISDQPWYHNAVCTIETAQTADELLKSVRQIETSAGRERKQRNEARVLDIDILIFKDKIIRDETLTLPHPRLHERAFVLYPLREVLPHWIHPVYNLRINQMIENLPNDQKIERAE